MKLNDLGSAILPRCPKCGATSGDTWAQCEGSCPLPTSPYHRADEARGYMKDLKEMKDAWERYQEGMADNVGT